MPLFVAAMTTNRTQWQAFALGFIWGAGLMGISLSFIFAMLPLDWLGITVPLAGDAAAAGLWAVLTAVLSVPIGLFAVLIWHLRGARGVVLACISPIAWVLLELARASLVSILALGPGTSIGPYFTFGFLGYALAGAHGLLVLAPLGGPLFLGWCIVLVNTAVFLALRPLPVKERAAKAIFCLAFLIGVVALNALLPARVHVAVGASVAEVGRAQVVLVHSDEDASFKVSPDAGALARAHLAGTIVADLASGPGAKVVVLPEDSRFERTIVNPSTAMDRAVLAALSERQALLIGSGRVSDGQVSRGVVYAYDFAVDEPVQFSVKSYLVPFGEYVPYVASVLGRAFGFERQMQGLADVRASYVSGDWNPEERVVRWNGVSYGLLSCSELFYPYFVRDLADAGADAIVVMSSHSWIRSGSPVLFNQMLGMAVVDAAWVGKPYLQATNKAPNIFISIEN